MKTAREFYDAILDCEGDIQGTILIEARDREVRAAALREVRDHLLGYSKFLKNMGFREAADAVWSVTGTIESAAALGKPIAEVDGATQ